MRVIGITGGVGAGKSTVLEYLRRKYHAVVVEADKVGHKVMEPGERCYQPMISLLGREILKEDGRIDRKKVGTLVFSNPSLLKKLNKIIHPAVKETILELIEKERRLKKNLFVVEAALLLEDHYDTICDDVWYIHADKKIRRQRLKQERGYSDQKIDDIFSNQLSENEFRERCRYIIINNGNLEETYRQIEERLTGI